MVTRKRHRITARQLDILLYYLPMFEQATHSNHIIEMVDGQIVNPDYQADLAEFVQDFTENRIGIPFDWPKWEFSPTPSAIAEANFPTLLKELTRCVRQEQFAAGTLQAACESGHLAAILKRLQYLRRTMTIEDVVVITYDINAKP